MSSPLESILIVVCIAGFFVLQYRSRRKSVAQTEFVREHADAQFREFRSTVGDERYWFIGSEAQIVDETEEGVTINDSYRLLRIQRYARNRHGEYFLFIADGTSKPFFKYVKQSTARVVLQGKYLPPDWPT